MTLSSTIYAKYYYPLEGSIEKYEFNKITDEDLKGFKFLIKRNKHDDNFLDIMSKTFLDNINKINLMNFDDALKECDTLLENKVKKFEEKFGKDEFGRPYILFVKNNGSLENATPNLTKEKYEKIKDFANNANFQTTKNMLKAGKI